MLTDAQIGWDGYRIERMDDRMVTCDMALCSLMPSCAPSSTSCGDFGT